MAESNKNGIFHENVKVGAKERGRNNFPNYASQLQAAFVRSQIIKLLK